MVRLGNHNQIDSNPWNNSTNLGDIMTSVKMPIIDVIELAKNSKKEVLKCRENLKDEVINKHIEYRKKPRWFGLVNGEKLTRDEAEAELLHNDDEEYYSIHYRYQKQLSVAEKILALCEKALILGATEISIDKDDFYYLDV